MIRRCLYCNKELTGFIGYYTCYHGKSQIVYDYWGNGGLSNILRISITMSPYMIIWNYQGCIELSELYIMSHDNYKLVCKLPDWFIINDISVIENKIKSYALFF